MFPTANSTIYRNEDGEVLGWDTHYETEDYGIDGDRDFFEDYTPEPADTAECIRWGRHAQDGDGTDEDDVFECCLCGGKFHMSDDGTVTLR